VFYNVLCSKFGEVFLGKHARNLQDEITQINQL
jgi:hypothetical protein